VRSQSGRRPSSSDRINCFNKYSLFVHVVSLSMKLETLYSEQKLLIGLRLCPRSPIKRDSGSLPLGCVTRSGPAATSTTVMPVERVYKFLVSMYDLIWARLYKASRTERSRGARNLHAPSTLIAEQAPGGCGCGCALAALRPSIPSWGYQQISRNVLLSGVCMEAASSQT
jgi:hypothetical protein